MPHDPDLLTLAEAVLRKQRDSTWDSRGTSPKALSQASVCRGTAELSIKQSDNPTVPLSQALESETVGHFEKFGTAPGTVAGHPYVSVLAALHAKCPEFVETDRWQQAVRDAETFLKKWGGQAHALGWTVGELFGLHPIPERPAPAFWRLARYDSAGLIGCCRAAQ